MQRRKGGKTHDIKNPVCNHIFSTIRYLVINARLHEIKLGPRQRLGAFTLEGNEMKQYLIRIESRTAECITINGDSPSRPFQIANNLWNYSTPGHAARRLEKLAQCWENLGYTVKRVYGPIWDMPTRGSGFNVAMTLLDFDGR